MPYPFAHVWRDPVVNALATWFVYDVQGFGAWACA